MATSNGSVSEEEYRALADFRYGLRKFLRFSEAAAREHGITPQQHQLLLAIKGCPRGSFATVSELAERLQLLQHSVVGIIDRSEQVGLVVRRAHAEDLRVTEIHLTPRGEEVLEALTRAHRDELQRSRDFLARLDNVLSRMPSDSGEGRSE